MTGPAARVSAAAQLSHPGLVREHNEDRTLMRPPRLAVADGVGGARGGGEAADLAIAAVDALDDDPSVEEIADALRRANSAVVGMIAAEPERAGMGTTVTVVVVREGNLDVVHVGDSRAYLVRGSRAERLTEDHSFVNELVRIGAITAEQADRHPNRNVIVRAIGAEEPLEPETRRVEVAAGDVVLVCTDGLTSQVSDADIGRIVTGSDSLEEAADALVQAANEAGGLDNVSVVLARVA